MTREELGAKVRRLQQAVAEVQGNTHLGGVTIRTDANGRLTELSITHDAWSRGPEALADLIARACQITSQEVQIRSTAIMAELRDDPVVARIARRSKTRACDAGIAIWRAVSAQPGISEFLSAFFRPPHD